MTAQTVAATQRALNRTSADRWELFAPHRQRVTELVLSLLPPGRGRLCVLGAGNCNDIDLQRLGVACSEIHLVDIDEESLMRGLERQGRPREATVVLHPGVDLTGVAHLLDFAHDGALDPDRLIGVADASQATQLPADFDVVLSAAVLTQLIRAAAAVLGEDHPRMIDVALALRAGHLRTLIDRIRPGGRALLITEVASTMSIAELADAPDESLGDVLLRAIATRRLFTATSPATILRWLMAERPAGARLHPPGIVGPWRWMLNRKLHLLVIGLLMRRPDRATAGAREPAR